MTEDELFDSMKKVKGEVRVVYQCSECKKLYGRRYIPYGIGFGLTINACFCQMTSRNVPSIKIEERRP